MNNADMPAMPLPLATAQDGEVIDTGDYCPHNNGLTKREAFAMAAMQGCLACDTENQLSADTIAHQSIECANALLKALENDDE